MKLDPLLAEALSGFTFGAAESIVAERANEIAFHRSQIGKTILPRPSEVLVQDEEIGGPDRLNPVVVRIYAPPGPSKRRAALVFAHGGGWATGSIETSDQVCGNLACDADIVVISVEYRLAPEYRFPAGIEDYYHAVTWAFKHADRLGIDAAKIAVGGESAGGNLAAVACLMARDRNGPRIAMQFLWAPALDLTLGGASAEVFRRAFPMIANLSKQMLPRYLGEGASVDNPYVSPLLAENLHALPPAVLFGCDVDPLRDDCQRYAEKLIAAGGTATWRVFPGLLHGTQSMTALLPIARQWHEESVRILRTF